MNLRKQVEELAKYLSEPGRLVTKSDWELLDSRIASMFPDWYRDLMEAFPVGDVSLDIDTEKHQIFFIAFAAPWMIAGGFEEVCDALYGFSAIFDSEYFPICFGENGEIFLCKRTLPSPVRYFLPDIAEDDTPLLGFDDEFYWESVDSFASQLIPSDYDPA